MSERFIPFLLWHRQNAEPLELFVDFANAKDAKMAKDVKNFGHLFGAELLPDGTAEALLLRLDPQGRPYPVRSLPLADQSTRAIRQGLTTLAVMEYPRLPESFRELHPWPAGAMSDRFDVV